VIYVIRFKPLLFYFLSSKQLLRRNGVDEVGLLGLLWGRRYNDQCNLEKWSVNLPNLKAIFYWELLMMFYTNYHVFSALLA
jgi:hypothetical protein